MSDSPLCLDARFSTTRSVTTIRPEILSHPGDRFETMLFLPNHPARTAEGGLRTQGYFKLNEPDKPLISVITVVFNGEKYLEQTIRSVIEQSYDNVEYLIIDGGSTDGTLDIIKRYDGQIDYWVSEKDKGIYDAMNKGISLCSGIIIGIINADDWYEPNIFSEVQLQQEYDILHGNIQYWNDQIRMEVFKPNQEKLELEMTLNHPTCFVKARLYKKIGYFNQRFKIAADYDFLLRAKNNQASFLYASMIISNMRYLGVSDRAWVSSYKNFLMVKIKNHQNIPLSFIYFLFQITRRLSRILLEIIGLKFIITYYRKNYSIMYKD